MRDPKHKLQACPLGSLIPTGTSIYVISKGWVSETDKRFCLVCLFWFFYYLFVCVHTPQLKYMKINGQHAGVGSGYQTSCQVGSKLLCPWSHPADPLLQGLKNELCTINIWPKKVFRLATWPPTYHMHIKPLIITRSRLRMASFLWRRNHFHLCSY